MRIVKPREKRDWSILVIVLALLAILAVSHWDYKDQAMFAEMEEERQAEIDRLHNEVVGK